MPPAPPRKIIDETEAEDRKRKIIMWAIVIIAVIGMGIAVYKAPREKPLVCKNDGPVGLTTFGTCVEE